MSRLGDWIGRTIGLDQASAGFWTAFFGGRNSAGKPVTSDSTLTIAAAWACIRIVAETVGVLPYFVYRAMPDGSRVVAREHPLYSVLHDAPNPDFSATEIWEAVAACICLQGNAFALKLEYSGRVVGLELLDPRTVDVRRLPGSHVLRYRFTYRDKHYDVGPDKVVHWRGFGFGGDLGLSPIRYGANTFGIAMAADDAAGGQFRNIGNTSGFITTKDGRVLKDEQRKQFQKVLNDFQADENPAKVFMLEGGFEWKDFGINPNDMQLLQARGFSVEQVCSFFRVPPFMIGHQEKSTSWGTGLEQTILSFLTFTLMTYLTKIQKRNDLALLTPGERAAGFYTEFAIEGLLRADSAARAAFYSIMTMNGMYTRDEVRSKENLPKKGGNADVLTVQSALVPLDMLGQAPAAGDANAVRNALRAFLEIEGEKPRGSTTAAGE